MVGESSSSRAFEPDLSINLNLLGDFSVRIGPQEVPETTFARRKARNLLKLLALQPDHRLHREQAMDLLWPDLPPRAAAAQLYKAVHQVRQAFATAHPELPPENLLEVHGEVISLKAPGGVHTDVEEFEGLAQAATRQQDLNLLQRAVAAYRGDLLPTDLYDRSTPPGSPKVLRGEEAAEYWRDVCAREMTHRVENEVIGAERVAFNEACEYPDGTKVLAAETLDVRDGKIVKETIVQAWDE